MKQNIWEGIYHDFAEISCDEYSFDTNAWANSQINELKLLLNNNSDHHHRYLLKPAFDLFSLTNKNIKIIDFGGGLGVTYIREFRDTNSNVLDHYTVIERSEICKLGNTLLEEYKNLSFCNSLNDSNADIVFCGSSFHYVEDWKKLLLDFFKLSPDIILFSDLPIGINREFITSQRYYEYKIPVRFFNLKAFEDYMSKYNYRLSYLKEMPNKYNNHLQSFPSEYRLDSFKELLFVKNVNP